MLFKISKNLTINKLNNLLVRNFAKRYTKQHEWIEVIGESTTAKIGISDYAQSELGTLVHIDLPEKGITLSKGDSLVINF